MIYEHVRATGAHDAVQGLSDLFNIRLQNDDVQDFDVRWDQALLSASETPAEMVLEWFYKSKLQDSVQLQTVLHLYDQETVRDTWQPSYSRLKTATGLHIDQAMRTRNFRFWNEIVKTRILTLSLCEMKQDSRMRRDARSSTIPNPCQERVQGPLFSHWRKLFS